MRNILDFDRNCMTEHYQQVQTAYGWLADPFDCSCSDEAFQAVELWGGNGRNSLVHNLK